MTAAVTAPMKILVAHNSYLQRGGEDHAVDDDVALLRAHGHSVIEYRRHNDELAGMPAAAAARDTLWSPRTLREVSALLQKHQPHIVHAHNIFPLISPSLYSAAAAARVPVVQTLHNYRIMCLADFLLVIAALS